MEIFWTSYSVVSVKPIQHNMRYLGWSSRGKKTLMSQDS